jgi:hypothetical protein
MIAALSEYVLYSVLSSTRVRVLKFKMGFSLSPSARTRLTHAIAPRPVVTLLARERSFLTCYHPGHRFGAMWELIKGEVNFRKHSTLRANKTAKTHAADTIVRFHYTVEKGLTDAVSGWGYGAARITIFWLARDENSIRNCVQTAPLRDPEERCHVVWIKRTYHNNNTTSTTAEPNQRRMMRFTGTAIVTPVVLYSVQYS